MKPLTIYPRYFHGHPESYVSEYIYLCNRGNNDGVYQYDFGKRMLLLLNNSCCNEKNENSGIIISDYKIEEADYFYPSYLITPDTACIRDDISYRTKIVIDTSYNSYKNLTLPVIDFSKVSLLVNRKFPNGRIFFQRSVYVDSVSKTVTFQITTTSCYCPDKCESLDLNIVIVPKISSDYKIIYK